LVAGLCAGAWAGQSWGPYRGANAPPSLSENDVRDFAALGGNLLRVGFASEPMMTRTPPYEFNEEPFVQLDRLLDYCEKYGIDVVIDPHTTPGTEFTTTTHATDALWRDFRLHGQLIRLWSRIAYRYKDRGHVIAGYDLLNEPSVSNGAARDTPADWDLLVRKLVHVIRAVDSTHAIIIETASIDTPLGKQIGPLEGMDCLDPPPDSNVVYSPHMYEPADFTFQGIRGRPEPVPYPGFIRRKLWNRAALERALEPVGRFQQTRKVPIFIGEFSAPRWLGVDGNRYVRDVIEICEEHGWSWAYHASREADVWDAERSNDGRSDHRWRLTTPRLEILEGFFRRNRAAR
jgi:hypothetical protein